MRLLPRRRVSPALLDLLPWDQFVAEGVLAQVDGSLMATFGYRGPDLDSATAEELEALSATVAKALAPLGDGWMLHLEAQRTSAPGYPAEGHFPDPFTRALDAERRRAYEATGAHFHSEYFLTLTHRPEQAHRRGLASRLQPPEPDLKAQEREIEAFEAQLQELEGLLGAQLQIRRLGSGELLGYLYRSLTCRHHRLEIARYPVSLEAVFGAGDLYAGYEVRFSETHIVPVALAGFPGEASPAALDFLNELPMPYHLVLRFLPLDPYTARRALTRRRTQWSNAGLGIREVLAMVFAGAGGGPRFKNRYAPAMAKDADDALLELESAGGGAGYLSSTVLLFDTDRSVAVSRAQTIVKELRNRGFIAWIEQLNAVHAYLGSLPGCGGYNVRRPIFLTRAFLDLALLTSVWPGSPTHPHPALSQEPAHVVASTSGSTPFYLNLGHVDVQHTLVAGPTGAGKSILVALLMAQFLRYPGSQVFAIDKGYSLYGTALAAGGIHYALSADGGAGDHRFAPLERLDTAGSQQVALEWLEDLIRLQGLGLDPHLRGLLQRGVELLATTRSRSLTQLAGKLQHPSLRQAVAPYTGSGPYAHLFDAATNPLRDGHLHVFEMEHVLPLKAAAVTPLVLHLFSEIEARLDGRPTLILVEEALAYLGDTLWSKRFAGWLFELRKKNAGVLFVAQTLSSLLASPLRDALIESCPTKILLPNPAAREPATAQSYRAFGLNDRQIEILATATPRRDYYAISPAGSRLFRLDLSPGALAILGLAGPTGREQVHSALERHSSAWVQGLLREQGFGSLADLIETHPIQEDPTPCGSASVSL